MLMKVKITFVTATSISQGDGLNLWQIGSHFCAAPGPRTYTLKSEAEVESLLDGLAGLEDEIRTILEQDIAVINVQASVPAPALAAPTFAC